MKNDHKQTYSNAQMRMDIYHYLEAQGFQLTEERHKAIHEILSRFETEKIRVLNDKLSTALNKS